MNEYQEKRESLGLSRAELARLLGVTRMTIYNRETGRHEVRSENMLALKALEHDA